MNNVIWISVQEASIILECTRQNVHLLMRTGNLRRRERKSGDTSRKEYCRHSDCVDYRNSSAWRACKARNVGANRKGMRAKKDQPVIPDDIEKLLKGWNGSVDQKNYKKRYSR